MQIDPQRSSKQAQCHSYVCSSGRKFFRT